jgi:hypothetical protein
MHETGGISCAEPVAFRSLGENALSGDASH